MESESLHFNKLPDDLGCWSLDHAWNNEILQHSSASSHKHHMKLASDLKTAIDNGVSFKGFLRENKIRFILRTKERIQLVSYCSSEVKSVSVVNGNGK